LNPVEFSAAALTPPEPPLPFPFVGDGSKILGH